MTQLSYVRTEMLKERPPPTGTVGLIKWLRENLFSSIPSTILTLLTLYFLYSFLNFILPWMLQSSWTAGSLQECRENIREAYGAHAEGACWAVIRDRYLQLLYGFYPPELYWRINLAFILMFVALLPILFKKLPRKMLWISLLYPFFSFWLFWGGSIWPSIITLSGFAFGYFAFVLANRQFGVFFGPVAAISTAIIWWLLMSFWGSDLLRSILPIEIEYVESGRFGGFMLSILIGVSGIVLSLPIGICLALGRQSNLFIIKAICIGFIEFIRGVPLITLLFVASTLLNYFMPPQANFDIILRVIIMVTLFASAYMAEVIRGGLAALPKGQYEAADSLGMNFWMTTGLIIMPQALKISIPSIVSTFIGLFKDTTLVSIIGLLDPIGLSTNIRANQEWNGIIWELYGFIALIFWIFCFSMSRYSIYLERTLKTSH